MHEGSFSEKLLRWYHQNKRDLPWRKTKNPYPIWLSEVILQQTRVAQGLPYYHRFINAYPNIHKLYEADENEVLRHWQGLGYYSRGRNLLKCARMIVEDFNGQFPQSFSSLLKLPGIGQYTAAAIASFAFDEPVPVVDGNVFRVLSRIFGIYHDIGDPKSLILFKEVAGGLLPEHDVSTFNQSLMEFGALQCVPGTPDCSLCPFSMECHALRNKKIPDLPVKGKKKKSEETYYNYMVFSKDQKIWMRKRTGKGIWNGLFDFYLLETKKNQTMPPVLSNKPLQELIIKYGKGFDTPPSYKHILTHKTIYASFYDIDISKEENKIQQFLKGGKFYELSEIERLPKPILIDKFLKDNLFVKFNPPYS
ncbi:MAG: A/G-specific adenine glycosylase [Cyclobacteriaceae bacterium]|nr:A/G-specific adenine glycosylase [Cyclobacteriaceae bacterium]